MQLIVQAFVGLLGIYLKRLATAEFANYVVHSVLNAVAKKYPDLLDEVQAIEGFIDGNPPPPPKAK